MKINMNYKEIDFDMINTDKIVLFAQHLLNETQAKIQELKINICEDLEKIPEINETTKVDSSQNTGLSFINSEKLRNLNWQFEVLDILSGLLKNIDAENESDIQKLISFFSESELFDETFKQNFKTHYLEISKDEIHKSGISAISFNPVMPGSFLPINRLSPLEESQKLPQSNNITNILERQPSGDELRLTNIPNTQQLSKEMETASLDKIKYYASKLFYSSTNDLSNLNIDTLRLELLKYLKGF